MDSSSGSNGKKVTYAILRGVFFFSRPSIYLIGDITSLFSFCSCFVYNVFTKRKSIINCL